MKNKKSEKLFIYFSLVGGGAGIRKENGTENKRKNSENGNGMGMQNMKRKKCD
jgi:hypothetical protein